MTAIPQTAAVEAPTPQRVDRTRFCSRCACICDEPDGAGHSYGFGRVCERCGMGVILSTARQALPGPGGAFMVVTREGCVSAVSEAAEALVGEEAGLLGLILTTAITTADDDAQLIRCVARAAGGGREITESSVIPAAASGGARAIRMKVRIASCGPPRAALLVLERAPL